MILEVRGRLHVSFQNFATLRYTASSAPKPPCGLELFTTKGNRTCGGVGLGTIPDQRVESDAPAVRFNKKKAPGTAPSFVLRAAYGNPITGSIRAGSPRSSRNGRHPCNTAYRRPNGHIPGRHRRIGRHAWDESCGPCCGPARQFSVRLRNHSYRLGSDTDARNPDMAG